MTMIFSLPVFCQNLLTYLFTLITINFVNQLCRYMDEKEKSSLTIFDEMFVGAVLLFLSSIICGKLISAPLGNILLVGCGFYVFAGLFLGFACLFLFTFSQIDEEKAEKEHKAAKPQPNTEPKNSKGYFIYFAAIYIVFWVLMFIIFPQGTDVGEFIRHWNGY